MGNMVLLRRRCRYGNHLVMSESNEVDTVGLFHSTEDAINRPTSRQETSIFTLDRLRHDFDCNRSSRHSPGTTDSATYSNFTTGGDVTPLDTRFRYHLFFCHHERDVEWVEWAAGVLGMAPYGCSCCLTKRDFDSEVSRLQNVLDSVMRSRRVVFVVSAAFLEESWKEIEEGLIQLVYQGHGRHRMITVILDDCVTAIPDLLRMELIIDARHDPRSEAILQTLFSDGVSYSQSMHTVRSLSFQSNAVDYNNGQVLADVCASVDGLCQPRIRFSDDDVPELLANSEAALNSNDYRQVVRSVSGTEAGVQKMPWLFSAAPSILLSFLFFLWCISFILVILLFPDNQPSTLPVRLSVFCLPALILVLGCVLRWRRLKQLKEEYSRRMFANTGPINKLLFSKNRPILVTAGRTREDEFHIYFVHFDVTRCLERTKLLLTYCSHEDIDRLAKLIAFYAISSQEIEASTVPEQLLLMMCSSYALTLVLRRLPQSLEQRHTRRRQCLCQFLEEFLVAYLSWTRRETNPVYIKHVFQKYLNRRLKPDSGVLNKLGITIIEA